MITATNAFAPIATFSLAIEHVCMSFMVEESNFPQIVSEKKGFSGNYV
jgi:hypothetical protein